MAGDLGWSWHKAGESCSERGRRTMVSQRGRHQLGLGETKEEKSRGKRAQVWWAEESGHFSSLLFEGRAGLSSLPLSAQGTLIVLAEPWPSFLLISSKNSNCTRETDTKPIIKAAREISQSIEV